MHRDLTPNNIMLGEHDKVTISKVLIHFETFHIFILPLRNKINLHLYVRVIFEVIPKLLTSVYKSVCFLKRDGIFSHRGYDFLILISENRESL